MPDSLDRLSAYELSSEEIDDLLRTSPDDPRLREHFAEAEIREFSARARSARGPRRRGDRVVYVIPGILGSTLGTVSGGSRNTIWFDPHSIREGEVSQLRLTAASRRRIRAFGQIPAIYTRLRWQLWWEGNDVRDYAYDWRLSIDELGAELRDELAAEESDEIHLVAHSLGGLVARSAYAQADPATRDRIRRLIMLGTPNRGSFAAVQVLDGTNATVQFVGCLDETQDAEELVENVFNTFPSVYQMLPHQDAFGGLDLYDRSTWSEPKPIGTKLAEAIEVQQSLAEADDKFVLFAGVGQPTAVDAKLNSDGEFDYEVDNVGGDGTVPLDMAVFGGIEQQTRIFEVTHNGLATDGDVAKAVGDIIEHGETDRGERYVARRSTSGPTRGLTAAALKAAACYGGRRGSGITDQEAIATLRHGLTSVPSDDLGTASVPTTAGVLGCGDYGKFSNLVVGRRTQHRLELELQHGNLFDVPVRAYVLGIFENVTPGGPAKYVDEITHGAVSEFIERRLLKGDMGRVFMMPVGRNPLLADFIVFAGLGNYSSFQSGSTGDEEEAAASVQRFVARNVVRTLIQSGIDELAMLPIGVSSGADVCSTIDNLFHGFVEAVKAGSDRQKFRRVVICENDATRYAEMREHILRRTTMSPDFDDVEITIDEVQYGDRSSRVRTRSLLTHQEQPVYLTVRMNDGSNSGNSDWIVESSLLTSGGKATVFARSKSVPDEDLDELLSRLDVLNDRFAPPFDVESFGRDLTRLMFDDNLRMAMADKSIREKHLVVIHDAGASRIPWETMLNEVEFPVLGEGLTRRYFAENLSVTKWLAERSPREQLRVLLVFDPTDDLDGAEEEGEWIVNTLSSIPEIRVTVRREGDATVRRIKQDLNTGDYDVLHYAGHSEFKATDRANSGLKLADGTLRGSDLNTLERLPALVMFNSCQSARVRRSRQGTRQQSSRRSHTAVRDQLEEKVTVAEALFNGGIGQFIGTYWPVDDRAAEIFAKKFYADVTGNEQRAPVSVGEAVAQARREVKKVHPYDWANYIHYGEPHFRLRKADRQPQ